MRRMLVETWRVRDNRRMFRTALVTLANVVGVVFRIVCAIVIPSLWFGVNAGFLGVLATARFFILKDYTLMKLRKGSTELGCGDSTEARIYSRGGILLIILGISYFFVSVYMYYNGGHTEMPAVVTWLVAASAFTSVGCGIGSLVKNRRRRDATARVLAMTNFAKALTAIALTQVTLLETYAEASTEYLNHVNGLTGVGVSVVIMVIGLMMIIKTRE